MSKSREIFIKNYHKTRFFVRLAQISLFVFFIISWEIFASLKVIDSFIFSQPTKIVNTLISMFNDGSLLLHTSVTFLETVVSFLIGTLLGTVIAIGLWSSEMTAKILDPYLVLLNALPKTALGPIILVWVGGNTSAIIVMALLISIVITIMSIYTAFVNTDEDKIKLLKSFGASERQIFTKVIFPANIKTIISVLKINVGLSLVGVILGEFLVSKSGLGYLIIYGGQVFNMNLVMASIIVLSLMAAFLYYFITILEKRTSKY